MKNSTKNLIPIFILLLFITCQKTNAQDCFLPQAKKELNANNISTNILNGGDLFWNRTDAHFTTNGGFPIEVSSIFNAGFWISGFTGLPDNPVLKAAAANYNSTNKFDFSAGPLSELGTTDLINCSNYDQLWEVFGDEIKQHIEDFNDDGIVANQQSNIYGYPAQGNPFFEDIQGFSLPDFSQGLAPFWDNDSDGIYNPDNGDYPLPSSVDKDHFPAQLIWGIFNDAGANHTSSGGDAIRVEIQLTAWAFSCSDNLILNNTIFTSHKIINKALDPIDSLYAGVFIDFDLGCFTDDYVGSIPSMNTFYAYNSDESDGDNGVCPAGVNSYASNPPVQAVTYLNQSMSSFATTYPAGSPNTNQLLPASYFNLLSGSWDDGTPFTEGGNGYNLGGQPTSFLYPDNPNYTSGWSMASEVFSNGDFRTISAVYLDEMPFGSVQTIDMAYTFYQDETLNNLETVDLVYQFTPQLQQMYDDRFEMTCDHLYLPNENLEISDIEIFPNPTSDILNIKMENPTPSHFTIFDIYGKKVFEKTGMNQGEIQLSTSNFSQGVYFLKIEMEGKEFVHKFIKL